MKVIAAYLLLVLGGNTAPSVEDINTLLGEVGIDADTERVSSSKKHNYFLWFYRRLAFVLTYNSVVFDVRLKSLLLN